MQLEGRRITGFNVHCPGTLLIVSGSRELEPLLHLADRTSPVSMPGEDSSRFVKIHQTEPLEFQRREDQEIAASSSLPSF